METSSTTRAGSALPSALLARSRCMDHDTGSGHPEHAGRFRAVLDGLEAAGLVDDMLPIEPRPATEPELRLCHSKEYLRWVEDDTRIGTASLRTGDTAISAESLNVAREMAGGVLNAVDAILDGRAANAFCAVRPPGHHASPARGMGFCIFNNAGIAARYAQQHAAIARVLLVDWDVHHGNGTQDIFYDDGSVLFFSTHQYPWYPGTGTTSERGRGEGQGTTINCPFPAGSGRKEIVGAFEKELMPAADAFRPDLVVISAGFDSRIDDPLGHFLLEDDDFAELTRIMIDIARRHCSGRLLSVLEGGYSLRGLASASAAHVRTLVESA